ncbi:MAG: hypothetical protein LQ348_000190 [Seirophora lacunosa]|nr:MAG: hypothetical protein LQ348_000190 [Seirophora lacunosa]
MFEVSKGMKHRCMGRNHQGPDSDCENSFKSILLGVARELGFRGPAAKLNRAAGRAESGGDIRVDEEDMSVDEEDIWVDEEENIWVDEEKDIWAKEDTWAKEDVPAEEDAQTEEDAQAEEDVRAEEDVWAEEHIQAEEAILATVEGLENTIPGPRPRKWLSAI